MIDAVSRKYVQEHVELSGLMKKYVAVGVGAMFAAALIWGEERPMSWGALGVLAVALVLLGTGYHTSSLTIPEVRVQGDEQYFPPVGQRIESADGLKALFTKGYGGYAPLTKENYFTYIGSKQFKENCKKTKVYYSQRFCRDGEEAYYSVAQRHLVNVKGQEQGDQEAVAKLLGVEASYSYIHEGRGANSAAPGLVGVFTHTPVFTADSLCKNVRGWCSCTVNKSGEGAWYGSKGRRVDLFSVPGPALDSPCQPNFAYFVSSGRFERERYGDYMEELFKMALCAFFDESKAIEFVLPEVGLGTFLGALVADEKQIAIDTFYASLETVLKSYRTAMWTERARARGVASVMFTSIFPSKEQWWRRTSHLENLKKVLEDPSIITHVTAQVIVRDIREYLSPHESPKFTPFSSSMSMEEYLATCKIERPPCPFVVNPCDPAARIGNHNDPARSFDGAIGDCTPASLVASPTHNKYMTSAARYIAV